MLHILLMILKILGIILLCIIGIVLLVLALILFVPVRYRIKAVKEETIDENGQKNGFAEGVFARIKVTWLCHFLSVTVEYQNSMLCKVRVLGIIVYDLAKKEEYAAKKAEKENRKEERERRKAKKHRNAASATTNHTKTPGLETEHISKQEAKTDKRAEKMSDEQTMEKQETEADEKLTFLQKLEQFMSKLKAFVYKILDAIRNIKYTIVSFCDKIKNAVNRVEYYKAVWDKEETKRALATGKKELGRLMKHLKPSKFKADIHFGLSDPATMGQILSFHGMLYPFLGKNVHIVPDFEKEVFEGNVYIKGRITIFVLLQVAWILYFDDNIRYLIRLLKKEES